MPVDLIQIISVGTNLGLLIVGLKLVRHLTQLESKVDTMWSFLSKKYGFRFEFTERNK
jgi:hypothetical protein